MSATHHFIGNSPGTYSLTVLPGVLVGVLASPIGYGSSDLTIYDGPVALNKIIAKLHYASPGVAAPALLPVDALCLTGIVAVISGNGQVDFTILSA